MNENRVTFVLMGPRAGYTGILGDRYGFKDGRLSVPFNEKDAYKLILCTAYACNIEGEAPLWATVDVGGKPSAVKVADLPKPVVETTTVRTEPKASTKASAPKVEPVSKDA